MTLLDEYRRHASNHGAFTFEGDAEPSKASYDYLQREFLSLARAGRRLKLLKLYEDADPWVQPWPAAHTLEIDEVAALAKLEELSMRKIPLVSSDAKHTIEEWTSGNLHFLPT